jgi:hypothetical protein
MMSIAGASIDIEADARLVTAEPAAMAIAMMPAAAAIADLLGSGARCCSFNSLPAVAGAADAVPQARQQQAELRLREKLQHHDLLFWSGVASCASHVRHPLALPCRA